MADRVALSFAGIQTAVIAVTAIFAWINIRKFRDSRGVDFVIHAESTIDPLYQGLVNAPSEVIRNIYRTAYDLSTLTDEEVKAFPFMQSLYTHVSRICFMIADTSIDLGLAPKARSQLLDNWMTSLGLYKGHPAMRIMHSSSAINRDYNNAFLQMADRFMTIPADAGTPSDPEGKAKNTA